MWEKDININEVKELRTKSTIYFGVGAIEKIEDIIKSLKAKNIHKAIVISGKNAYKLTGAWDYIKKALETNSVEYINYDKVSPNPTTHQVDEATKLARDFKAQAVIAIGGGSAIDAGKSAAILLEYPEKNATELYNYEFEAQKAVPIVAVNLTHGTGTEANRFAVVTIPEKDFKPAIAYDCIYPLYSIDDPKLTTKLSANQTLFVSVDAVNHVVEAATSKVASPYSITLAKETIRLVAKYLPLVIKNPDDLEARYYLLYASLLGGVSFDNGLLHYTHALEHPLSAIKHDLSHGLGLAMLLPAVVKHIYKEKYNTLSDILSPIISGLKAEPEGGEYCAKELEKWLIGIGIDKKLKDEGFSEADIEKLTELAFNTPSLGMLLGLAPNEASKQIVSTIYRESLDFYN